MPDNTFTDPGEILKMAKAILLVDWLNPGVPAALLHAGLTVFSYSPGRYSMAELFADRPSNVENKDIFVLDNKDVKEYLVFWKQDSNPGSVDIVNTYRPAEELAGIIYNHVLPLSAKALWLQPPVTSPWAQSYAVEHNLAFVEGMDIAEIARSLDSK